MVSCIYRYGDLEIWQSFAIEREKEAHGLIGEVDFGYLIMKGFGDGIVKSLCAGLWYSGLAWEIFSFGFGEIEGLIERCVLFWRNGCEFVFCREGMMEGFGDEHGLESWCLVTRSK
ncbi:hypothetical protein M0R45_026140 [Rubus argutus]|uniref:Uncharacterized protein n=1 Tax=Rubus argutus TaxID=59490 RepID=A0AAW1WW62_RUBAR